MSSDHDEAVLAAKAALTPAMPRSEATFECPKCGARYGVDGNCDNDGIPLRRLPASDL